MYFTPRKRNATQKLKVQINTTVDVHQDSNGPRTIWVSTPPTPPKACQPTPEELKFLGIKTRDFAYEKKLNPVPAVKAAKKPFIQDA